MVDMNQLVAALQGTIHHDEATRKAAESALSEVSPRTSLKLRR